jgi:hypothetical protein
VSVHNGAAARNSLIPPLRNGRQRSGGDQSEAKQTAHGESFLRRSAGAIAA